MSAPFEFILEWENALLSDVDRARAMLRELQQQARTYADAEKTSFDLRVMYDSDEIDVSVPQSVVDETIDRDIWPGEVRFVAAPGLEYYEQKNLGVEQSEASIIIFIDSDVIPQPGWLAALLSPLDDHSVKFVCGNTYQATDTEFDKISALFWKFDVKCEESGLDEVKAFYANNLAMRREHALKYPFPRQPTFRNQCSKLARTMLENGECIYNARDAWVSHPPVSGVSHFFQQAICQGHDSLISNRQRANGLVRANPLASAFRLVRGLVQAPTRILRRNAKLGLGGLTVLKALLLSFVYQLLLFVGEVMAFVSPKFVRKRFNV
ncbi:MAG: glycosyltransferase [Pseudomonadota bacterium]